MEAYWGLGAAGRSCSNPFAAKSTEYFTNEAPVVGTYIDASLGGHSGLMKQHCDEDSGPVMGSFCNPITAESIANAENFTVEGPVVDTLVSNYKVDASLTEFIGLEENLEVDSVAVGGSFSNPMNAESIANAGYYIPHGPTENTMFPNFDADSGGLVGNFCNPFTSKSTPNSEYENLMFDTPVPYYEDDGKLFGSKGYSNEGSYDAVYPFLPTSTPLALNVDAINEVFHQENQVGFQPITQQNIYDSNQPEKRVEFLQKLHAKGGELQPQLQLDFLQKQHAQDYGNQPKSQEEAKEEEEVVIIGEIPAPKKYRPSRKRKCDIIVSDEELRLDSSGWTKYGQKTLKGSTYPKGYYRCRAKGCPARKHVEKISENPDKFAVWFNNDHQHGQNPAAKSNAFDEKPVLQPNPIITTTASSDLMNSFTMNHDLIKNEEEDWFQDIKIKEEPEDWYERCYDDIA